MTASKIAAHSMDFLSMSVKRSESKSSQSFQGFMDKAGEKNKGASIRSHDSSVPKKGIKEQSGSNEKILYKNTAATDSKANVVKSSDIDEADFEKVASELVSFIESTLTQVLDVTEEELATAMDALGFTPFDMLEQSNQKQLILFIKGLEDVSSLLTDENLFHAVKELENELSMDVLTEQFHLPQVSEDELKTMLNSKELISTGKEFAKETVEEVMMEPEEKEVEISVVQEASYQGVREEKKDTSGKESNSYEKGMELHQLIFQGDNGQIAEAIDGTPTVREIVTQIVEQIKIHMKADMTSMELQLNPEHLGKVHVSVVEKNGILTAEFKTGNYMVKEAIESQLQMFKENLTNQGLKVESVEVTVSNFEFNQNNEAASKEQNNRNSKKTHFFYEDASIFTKEAESEDMLELEGSSVSYRA